MAIPKIMTGARAILRINNKVVAFATNVGYRITIPHGAVNVLGRYSAARHEPLGYDVTVSCGTMRFTAATAGGNSPSGAGGGNIFPKVQDIITQGELQIEVVDRATDETIILVSRARMTERSGSMGARDMLSEAWNFTGIVAEDGDSGSQAESSGPGSTPPNVDAAT